MHTRDEFNIFKGDEIGGVFDQVGDDLRPGFFVGQVPVKFLDDNVGANCDRLMDLLNSSMTVFVRKSQCFPL